jgi:hypothetical protein
VQLNIKKSTKHWKKISVQVLLLLLMLFYVELRPVRRLKRYFQGNTEIQIFNDSRSYKQKSKHSFKSATEQEKNCMK